MAKLQLQIDGDFASMKEKDFHELMGLLGRHLKAGNENFVVAGLGDTKISGGPVPAPRLVVHMDGGLIQDLSSDAGVEVYVLDYDTDGYDGDELVLVPQGETALGSRAVLSRPAVDILPERVEEIISGSVPVQGEDAGPAMG